MTATTTEVAPDTEVRTVRMKNQAYRTREHLTPSEVDALLGAVRKNRHGPRDHLMVLVCYRHGLRVSELCEMEWTDLDLDAGTFHVRRKKDSKDSTHPLKGDEVRALRRLRREQPNSRFVFLNERGDACSVAGFQKTIARATEAAGLGAIKPHPHMLRHSCGFALANKGVPTRTIQDYLGHVQIANTVIYTALSANQFRDLW